MRQARGAAKEPRPSRKRRRRRHPGFGGRAALGRPATRWRSAARRARAAVIGLISIWFLAFVLLDGVRSADPPKSSGMALNRWSSTAPLAWRVASSLPSRTNCSRALAMATFQPSGSLPSLRRSNSRRSTSGACATRSVQASWADAPLAPTSRHSARRSSGMTKGGDFHPRIFESAGDLLLAGRVAQSRSSLLPRALRYARAKGSPTLFDGKLQQLDCDGVSSRDRQLGVSVTGAVPKLARRISMQRPDFLPISPPETASRRIPQPGGPRTPCWSFRE